MNIVVVDDDPVYLSLLAEILTLYGHTVYRAPDGAAALEQLRNEQADLVISDVSMPNMNSVTLHSMIREDRRLRRIPFVWNSAYSELRELLEVMDPSIVFKVDKATELSSLMHIITRVDAARHVPNNVAVLATA